VSALKIVPQVLILASPSKSGDPRLSVQSNREHILLDLKEQMIDAKRLFGSLTDRRDFRIKSCGNESRRAQSAEAAGIGYGSNKRRGGRRAHTAQDDRMNDTKQIANARMNHGASTN
jgi:hypothetical protein